MDFHIAPYADIGPLGFGMGKAEVRQTLPGVPREFRKTPLSKNLTDDYGFCHVFYDQANRLVAVEFWPSDDAKLILDGADLLSTPYAQLRDSLAQTDEALEEDDMGFTSPRYGVGASAPSALSDCGAPPADSIIVFNRGYYD